jgi:hypothetical protein
VERRLSLERYFDEEGRRGRNRYNAYNNPFTVRAREFATKFFRW